jgi:hypothetical protein
MLTGHPKQNIQFDRIPEIPSARQIRCSQTLQRQEYAGGAVDVSVCNTISTSTTHLYVNVSLVAPYVHDKFGNV